MIVEGTLPDGRQVIRTHGGTVIETAAQRDARWAEDARQTVERAAPDMLAALKRALFVLESPTMPAHVNGAGTVDAVRAAISKAEGA